MSCVMTRREMECDVDLSDCKSAHLRSLELTGHAHCLFNVTLAPSPSLHSLTTIMEDPADIDNGHAGRWLLHPNLTALRVPDLGWPHLLQTLPHLQHIEGDFIDTELWTCLAACPA